MYICIHIYTHICVYVCIYMCIFEYLYIYIERDSELGLVYIRICTYMIPRHIYINMNIYIYIHICMCVFYTSHANECFSEGVFLYQKMTPYLNFGCCWVVFEGRSNFLPERHFPAMSFNKALLPLRHKSWRKSKARR